MKKRVLSGIRATGRLHLGNYLGAVKGMLALQEDPSYETFYMVADAHTITTPYSIEELRRNRREIIIDYLAAGLNPEKSVLFQQSQVSEHFELAFYFSAVTTIAKMQHLPTFKEKVKQYPHNSTMALLNYPILMSADILVYKADAVPVGIDQEPHLEVAREIARRFNQEYGTDFPEPKRFATEGEYVPSLSGTGKMSKSVEGSYINLTDNLETIRAKVARIPTDSGQGSPEDFEKRDGPMFGVLPFVKLFQGQTKVDEYKKMYIETGIKYKNLKDELAEAIYEELAPFQDRRAELEANPEYVDRVIREGAERAQVVARQTVNEVKEKIGLI